MEHIRLSFRVNTNVYAIYIYENKTLLYKYILDELYFERKLLLTINKIIHFDKDKPKETIDKIFRLYLLK